MSRRMLLWTGCLYALIFLSICQPIYGQTYFQDVTDSKGIKSYNTAKLFGSGISAADFDRDGDIDLFAGTGASTHSHLYRNDGTGFFEEISRSVGLIINDQVHSSIWLDYDGDHLLDLFVGGLQGPDDSLFIRLFKQNTDGTFVETTEASGLTIADEGRYFGGAATADVNNDGYLDIYYSVWQGGRYLFLNNRNGTFSNVTAQSIGEKVQQHFQPIFHDFDKNGFVDLQINVDAGPNELWFNNGDGTFENLAGDLGINSEFNEMGIALGDSDNDGDMEMYMTNIESPTRYNVLFRNDSEPGDLKFSEVSQSLGVGQGGWGWGTTFFDADNDGYLDLAATNGWLVLPPDQSHYWKNDQEGGFIDQTEQVNYDHVRYGSSLIAFDMDRDGDLDLVESLKPLSEESLTMSIMENQLMGSEEEKNWIVVKPRMVGANHLAIGSEVKIKTPTQTLVRPITAGISFWGQEPAEAVFGIGNAQSIEEISITWPDGVISTWEGFGANTTVTLYDSLATHKPYDLKIQSNGDHLVLSWGHMTTTQTFYRIQKSLTEDFAEVESFFVGGDAAGFHDFEVEADQIYYYRVKTIYEDRSSEYSQIASGTLNDLNEPTELKATVINDSQIELSWNDNSGNELGFGIERSLTSGFRFVTEYSTGINETTFVSEELPPNTTVYYRVKALHELGNSGYSNIVEIRTDESEPNVVTGIDDFQEHSKELRLFPNPANDFVQIELNNTYLGPLTLKLLTSNGQELGSWNETKDANIWDKRVQLPFYKGLYFITVSTSETNFVKKVIKID